MFVLLNPGTTVPLLLHDSLAVPVVIVPVEVTHLGQMLGSVTETGQSVRLSGSSNLLWCGGWFGWTWGFELLLGRSPFTLLLQHSLLVSEVPLVLCLFRLLGIFVGHLEQHCQLFWTKDYIEGSLRQSPISVQAQRRLKESVPMGGTTPDLPPVDQTHHLTLT